MATRQDDEGGSRLWRGMRHLIFGDEAEPTLRNQIEEAIEEAEDSRPVAGDLSPPERQMLKNLLQFGDQTGTQEHYDRVLPGVPQSELVAVRTNSSIVHYWTIVNGTGIGCLPTYAMALANHVVPIDLGLHFPFPIWLIYRREAAALPRVRERPRL